MKTVLFLALIAVILTHSAQAVFLPSLHAIGSMKLVSQHNQLQSSIARKDVDSLKRRNIFITAAHAASANDSKQCATTEESETAAASGWKNSKLRQTLKKVLPILASAFCAAAIMYPLDLVRALQMANAGSGLTTGQLLSNFHKAHGLKGFFTQGLAPELARSTWMRFIKFALFPAVHELMTGLPESKGNELTKAAVAIVSSIPEAISIMPLEISKIALQLDTTNQFKNNMFNAMGKVFKEQGLAGFTTGYFGVQYRQAAWSAGYFASIKFFEKQVKNIFQSANNGELVKRYPNAVKTASQLLSGFLAGVFGACFNTPGDTIRSTLQKKVLSQYGNPAALNHAMNSLSFLSVGKDIVKAKGFSALYAGFQFKAFHLGGGGALMAFLIPFFQGVFDKRL